jgi:hypothetical protein
LFERRILARDGGDGEFDLILWASNFSRATASFLLRRLHMQRVLQEEDWEKNDEDFEGGVEKMTLKDVVRNRM